MKVMSNNEQHEMLVGILSNLVPVLTCDELSLLAHCCGVRVEDFYYPTAQEVYMLNEQTRIAA